MNIIRNITISESTRRDWRHLCEAFHEAVDAWASDPVTQLLGLLALLAAGAFLMLPWLTFDN